MPGRNQIIVRLVIEDYQRFPICRNLISVVSQFYEKGAAVTGQIILPDRKLHEIETADPGIGE